MASNSSKALPYLAAFVLIASLAVEAIYEIEVDLETAIPFLMAIGLGGAGLKAVERASKARQMMPEEIKNFVKEQAKESQKLLEDFYKKIEEKN